MTDTPHGRLLGLDDAHLRELAPDATHQHRKGGLYRDLGPLMDGETGEVARNPDGVPYRAWLHVHPHARQVWRRLESETGKYRPIV